MYFCQAFNLLGECYHSHAILLNGGRIQIFRAFQKGLPESLCFTHNTTHLVNVKGRYTREASHKTSAFLACDEV